MTVMGENGQLKVVLPLEEAANWGLLEILQGKRDETAKFLLAKLLKTAADQIGWAIKDADYIIEIYPSKNRTTEVIFIPDKTKRILPLKASLKRQIREYVLEFRSSESLLTASKILYYSSYICNSGLYLFNGKYRLLIKTDNHKEQPLYLEIADRVYTGAKEYAVTAEYGHEICKEDAVIKLAKALIGQD